MADKKLFTLTEAAIDGTMKIAFGKSGSSSKNATLDTLKTWVNGATEIVKTTSLEIGPWNMNSDNYTLVYYPVGSLIPLGNIRGVRVLIKKDSNAPAPLSSSDLLSDQEGTAAGYPQILVSGLGVGLYRRTGGVFATDSNYNGSTESRGWVTIDYVE